MSNWTDLETTIAARVALEPAFRSVYSAAAVGLVSPTSWPSALITVLRGKTIDRSAVMGAIYVTKRVEFQVLIGTRMSGAAGESRLQTGGVWELYDKLQAKLLGFVPKLTVPPVAIWPCIEEDFFLDLLEPGAVDLDVLWSVDVKLQHPAA